jgi:hypothetical protein
MKSSRGSCQLHENFPKSSATASSSYPPQKKKAINSDSLSFIHKLHCSRKVLGSEEQHTISFLRIPSHFMLLTLFNASSCPFAFSFSTTFFSAEAAKSERKRLLSDNSRISLSDGACFPFLLLFARFSFSFFV